MAIHIMLSRVVSGMVLVIIAGHGWFCMKPGFPPESDDIAGKRYVDLGMLNIAGTIAGMMVVTIGGITGVNALMLIIVTMVAGSIASTIQATIAVIIPEIDQTIIPVDVIKTITVAKRAEGGTDNRHDANRKRQTLIVRSHSFAVECLGLTVLVPRNNVLERQ